jgi:hypothetical protein
MAFQKELTIYGEKRDGNKLSVVLYRNNLFTLDSSWSKDGPKKVIVDVLSDNELGHNGVLLENLGPNPKCGPRCPSTLKSASVSDFTELDGLTLRASTLGAAFKELDYPTRKLLISKYAPKSK